MRNSLAADDPGIQLRWIARDCKVAARFAGAGGPPARANSAVIPSPKGSLFVFAGTGGAGWAVATGVRIGSVFLHPTLRERARPLTANRIGKRNRAATGRAGISYCA